METSDKLFLAAISLLVIVALLITAYNFLIRRDYAFLVEASCDETQTTCFLRDCSGGDCPSNELEQYRIFSVRAKDFATCADNTCLQECLRGNIECTEISCGESQDDECSAPPDTPEQQ